MITTGANAQAAGSSALRRLDQTVGSEHPAAAVLEGILTSDSRELSGIWSTASGVLSAYRFPAALASTRGRAIDVNSFVAEAQTLYICSPSSVQQAVAPLVVGLLEEIKEASFRLHARQPELPSTLFALDEVANIAPMRGLPALVSEGGGQGVLTLACL
ncbi:MAG: type IV secretory system conjugative DNA transfer family protein, partial [Actinobacteria bacterium]|nr:type IV secretory system conjugative DNA transfer family protein [Actinomycetota bacterium]